MMDWLPIRGDQRVQGGGDPVEKSNNPEQEDRRSAVLYRTVESTQELCDRSVQKCESCDGDVEVEEIEEKKVSFRCSFQKHPSQKR